MQNAAREAYLETQVLTASPFKLRLMLIDGAIRFVNQTLQLWDEQRDEAAWEASIRAREIISELMSSVSNESSPLAKQILPIYSYIFRSITEAQLKRDREQLLDVVRVLGEERETWQQVCDLFADELETLRAEAPVEILAPKTIPAAPIELPQSVEAAAPMSFDSSRMTHSPATSRPSFPAPLSSPAATTSGSFSFEA